MALFLLLLALEVVKALARSPQFFEQIGRLEDKIEALSPKIDLYRLLMGLSDLSSY